MAKEDARILIGSFWQDLNLFAIAGKGIPIGVVKIAPFLQGFFEPDPGAMEPDFNIVQRYAQNFSDLLVGKPFQITENDHGLVVGGQVVDEFVDTIAHLLADHELVGGRGGLNSRGTGRFMGCLILERMVLPLIFVGRRAGFVDRSVGCNAINPCGETGSSLEFVQPLADLVKHLLGEVFGIIRAYDSFQVPEDPWMVFIKYFIECLIGDHFSTQF